MSRTASAVALAALLIVLGGVAFATGIGPAPGGDGASGSDVEEFPTATPTASGGVTATETTETATAAPGRPAFAFAIDRVERCGRTCRDVTSTLTNRGDAPATGVVVYTRVFVGNDTEGDVVWSGRESVGRLAPGATHTATRRVELSYREGFAVRRADGWITIQTTVRSDQRTVTVADRRDVA